MVKLLEWLMNMNPEARRQRILDTARSDLIDHMKNQEYYNAMVPMLKKRIDRLQAEIAKAKKV